MFAALEENRRSANFGILLSAFFHFSIFCILFLIASLGEGKQEKTRVITVRMVTPKILQESLPITKAPMATSTPKTKIDQKSNARNKARLAKSKQIPVLSSDKSPYGSTIAIVPNLVFDRKNFVDTSANIDHLLMPKPRISRKSPQFTNFSQRDKEAYLDLHSDRNNKGRQQNIKKNIEQAEKPKKRPEKRVQSSKPDSTSKQKTELKEKLQNFFTNTDRKIQPEKREKLKKTDSEVVQIDPEALQAYTQGLKKLTVTELQDMASSSSSKTLLETEKRGLRRQMQACWSPPIGLANAERLVVTLRVSLSSEGWLLTEPALLHPSPIPNKAFQIAYEEAVRAMVSCQPFKMPPEKYKQWKDVEVVFDPADMVLH
jgi:hypothetical protein